MIRASLLLLSLSLVTGCSMSSSEPITQTYRLTPTISPVTKTAEAHLKIGRPETSPGLNSSRIVLHIQPYRMDHYAAASWPDALPEYLHAVLVQAMGTARLTDSSGQGSQSGMPNFKMNIRVLDFQPVYPDSTQDTPEIVVRIELTLLRSKGQKIILHDWYEHRSTVAGNHMSEIIKGLNDAFQQVLNEMITDMNQAILNDLSRDAASLPLQPLTSSTLDRQTDALSYLRPAPS